jgi:hypothetical protein
MRSSWEVVPPPTRGYGPRRCLFCSLVSAAASVACTGTRGGLELRPAAVGIPCRQPMPDPRKRITVGHDGQLQGQGAEDRAERHRAQHLPLAEKFRGVARLPPARLARCPELAEADMEVVRG